MWDWGSEQQATFEKVKIPVKQMKALSISQAGLPFGLDVSVTLEAIVLGTVAETTEGGNSKILVPVLQGGRNWIYPIEQQLPAVYTVLQAEPLTKEQHILVRIPLPIKG